MKMLTQSGNSMRDLVEFANQQGLQKDQIVSMMQAKDGTFLLTYFVED